MNIEIEHAMKESMRSRRIGSRMKQDEQKVYNEEKSLARSESGDCNGSLVNYASTHLQLVMKRDLQCRTEEPLVESIACRRSRRSRRQRYEESTLVGAKLNTCEIGETGDENGRLNEYIEEYAQVVMREEMILNTKGQMRTRRWRMRSQLEHCTIEDGKVKCLDRSECGDMILKNKAGVKLTTCSDRSDSSKIVSKQSASEENSHSEYKRVEPRHPDNTKSNTDMLVTHTKSGIKTTTKHSVKRLSRSFSRATPTGSKQSLYYCKPPPFRRTLTPCSYRCKSIHHYKVPTSGPKADSRNSDCSTSTTLNIQRINNNNNIKKLIDEIKINYLHKRTSSIDTLSEQILTQTRKNIREEESRSRRKLSLVRKKMQCYKGTESEKMKKKKIDKYNRKIGKMYDGKPQLFTSRRLTKIYEGGKSEAICAVGIIHNIKYAITNIGL